MGIDREAVQRAARQAKAAGLRLAGLSTSERSAILRDLAERLSDPEEQQRIREANERDVEAAEAELRAGRMAAPLVSRLKLDEGKIGSLVEGLEQLASRGDPIGEVRMRRELDEGLILEQVVAPLGLVGVIFESRPDALVQIAGLALRSANAVLLKGGSEALHSNRALTELIHRVLEARGLSRETVLLLEAREEVAAILSLEGVIDLIVARGSSEFVQKIQAGTRIPVMGHASGLCHLYLHASAPAEMAATIAVDAKCSYPSACNAIETLLWEEGAEESLDAVVAALRERGVELRGDEATLRRHPDLVAASEADWSEEYGGLVLALRKVADMDEALAHIATYGSRHTETIVATDEDAAARFLREVDAASVFHNASSRFADGYRFGLGAEVGISTDKLHARGPVGVEGLTTYRYLLHGSGQVASAYGPGGRRFTHRDLTVLSENSTSTGAPDKPVRR